MNNPRDHLVNWLRDAHAMERQSEQMLRGQAKRLERYPKLAEGLQRHLDETLEQQQALEQCLQRLDASPSAMKDIAGRLAASAQTLTSMAASDETVKGVMACYAFEQMEVAAYTSLFAAAHQAGEIQCQRMCERMLQEERAMAEWLRAGLPQLVQAYLARDAAADRGVTTQSMAPGAAQPPEVPPGPAASHTAARGSNPRA